MEIDPIEVQSLIDKKQGLEEKIIAISKDSGKFWNLCSYIFILLKGIKTIDMLQSEIDQIAQAIEKTIDVEERKLLRKEKEQLREQLLICLRQDQAWRYSCLKYLSFYVIM